MADSLRGLTEPFKATIQSFLTDLRAVGFRPTVTSGRRTSAEQTRLYRDFLAGRSRLPVARPGTSFHEFGLAVDLVFPTVEQWEIAAEVAPAYGLLWRRSDPVHFELSREFLGLVTEIAPAEGSFLSSVFDFVTESQRVCDPFSEVC